MKRTKILLALLIIFLLLTGSALAMSSASYKLDWFVPLTGSGGSEMSSANYKDTVGELLRVGRRHHFWANFAQKWEELPLAGRLLPSLWDKTSRKMSSPTVSYKAYVTVGQTAIGASASANYGACLGYWCGQLPGGRLHLPLILR